VYRSNDHIYAQLIDDVAGHTLVAASSREDGVDKGEDGKVGVAKQVGELIGERAKAAGHHHLRVRPWRQPLRRPRRRPRRGCARGGLEF
jgi:large subunit ribosomal protein L18